MATADNLRTKSKNVQSSKRKCKDGQDDSDQPPKKKQRRSSLSRLSNPHDNNTNEVDELIDDEDNLTQLSTIDEEDEDNGEYDDDFNQDNSARIKTTQSKQEVTAPTNVNIDNNASKSRSNSAERRSDDDMIYNTHI